MSGVNFWSAVDSRSKSLKFKHTITGSVHDALWMLTTQWMFGEFTGEDTGSLLFTKTEVETTSINRFASLNGSVKAFNEEFPYQSRIEWEPVAMDLSIRIQMGNYWLKLLKINAPGDINKTAFIDTFSISLGSSPEEISNKDAREIRNTLNQRMLDGGALYEYLISGSGKNASQLYTYLSLTGSGFNNTTGVNDAIQSFKNYYKDLFYQPANDTDTSWMPSRLEYQAKCSAPEINTGVSQQVLVSNEYFGGTFDWYSFDLESNTTSNELHEDSGEVVNDNVIDSKRVTSIPTPIYFAGMPASRRLTLQDANYNYASYQQEKTGTISMLIKDYILGFSNEWMTIPVSLPVGTLARVRSIVAKDVFGDYVYVGGDRDNIGDKSWSMYTLSESTNITKHGDQLFIPPGTPQIIDSQDLEKVNFIRDEMADMAWALELIVPDELSGGKDGYTAAKQLVDYLDTLIPPETAHDFGYDGQTGIPEYGEPGETYAMLKYKLLTRVPENWIPFVPKQVGNTNRNIKFQRATFPRILQGRLLNDTSLNDIQLIKPRCLITSFGLNTNTQQPYYIYEEELPRAGVIVTRKYRRTRWIDGKTYLWMGREKTTGMGEGLSGLKFDSVEIGTLINQ